MPSAPSLAAPARTSALAAVALLHVLVVAALLAIPGVRTRLVEPALTYVQFREASRANDVEPPRPLPQPALREPMKVDFPMPIVALAPEIAVAPQADPRPSLGGVVPTPSAPPASPGAAGVEPPRFDLAYLRNPAPPYPSVSRKLKEHGRVVLNVLVSPAGEAQDIEVRSSSGFDRLDRAAVDAVRRWRFSPARHGSAAVAAWALVPILFQLDT